MPRVKVTEDLQGYLDEMVQPTLDDFDANPASRRHAFLACVVIAHAADYSNRTRSDLKRQSNDFKLVDQVAHAFKHVQSSLNQSKVIMRPPAYWGQAVWGLSKWDDVDGGVTLSDNVNIDLLESAKLAVALLREISLHVAHTNAGAVGTPKPRP